MLGMLQMALEDLQPCLQQALEFSVDCQRNQKRFERAIDRLMVGNLVGNVRLVVGGSIKNSTTTLFFDFENACGIGDVRDLGIGRFRSPLRESRAA